MKCAHQFSNSVSLLTENNTPQDVQDILETFKPFVAEVTSFDALLHDGKKDEPIFVDSFVLFFKDYSIAVMPKASQECFAFDIESSEDKEIITKMLVHSRNYRTILQMAVQIVEKLDSEENHE
jgi:hypothetical protein